ncbi:MAG: SBBP repeat-containing protein, partial [Myxococcota bacterium]
MKEIRLMPAFVCFLLIFACSGDGGAPKITYAGSPFRFFVGVTVQNGIPASTGGTVGKFSISPALPNGLSFDGKKGIISGSPLEPSAPGIYKVTASNSSGTKDTTISVEVVVADAKPWTRLLGFKGGQGTYASGNAAVADYAGNLVVAGSANGPLDGQPVSGRYDMAVARYSASGERIWTRLLGAANATVSGKGIAVDHANNVYVAGDTDGTLDGESLLGPKAIFIAKYDPTGLLLWTRSYSQSGTELTTSGIAVGGDGGIYLSGSGRGPIEEYKIYPETGYAYVARFNPAGDMQWFKPFGWPADEWQMDAADANGIAVGNDGSVYVVGDTGEGGGGRLMFVASYDSAGENRWFNTFGQSGMNVYARAITV